MKMLKTFIQINPFSVMYHLIGYRPFLFKSLPKDNILDLCKLKALADDI